MNVITRMLEQPMLGLAISFMLLPMILERLSDEDLVIVLDASFEDWAAIEPALMDPADDAVGSPVDFGRVRICHEPRFVYIDFETGRIPVNLQGLDGTLSLLLDIDGNERTGVRRGSMPGVDLLVEFSPPGKDPDKPRQGIGVVDLFLERTRSPYDLEIIQAPTHAATRFELRMIRGAGFTRGTESSPTTFEGDSFRGKLVFEDLNGVIRDQTEVFEHRLDVSLAPTLGQEEDPFDKPLPSLRVSSWNLQHGRIIKHPEVYERLLRAIQPDIICFQELTPDLKETTLARFLRQSLDSDDWSVTSPSTGAKLRPGIASRFPLTPISIRVPLDDDGRRSVDVPAARIQIEEKTVLVMSVHLKCCGRIGGREDRIRIAQASALREALADHVASVDAMIVAGDLNLVGSRDPLDQLRHGLDSGDRSLAIADLLQLDGRSNATWTDDRQPFVPGRLDWLLYGESALQFVHGFVLDTSDLRPRWLEKYRLQHEDTGRTSDHLPLVADFSWRE